MRMKQFTMQIEASEGMDAAARSRICLLHLNSWFYFLIFIDELLADAAGDYSLKGERKKKVWNKLSQPQISFGCFSRTHKQKPGHIYMQRGILSTASAPRMTTLRCCQKDGDLDSGQRKTEACEGSELLSLVI